MTTPTGRRQRIAKTVTVTAIALAVAGVAIAGIPAWATGPTPNLPQKNVDAWVMPLDQYISVGTVIANYVENRLTIPCMAEKGYTWAVPKRDVEAANNREGDVAVTRPLTEVVAQGRGYHPAPTDDPGRVATLELNSRAITDSEDKALIACLQRTRTVIPLPASHQAEASQDAVALSNAAYAAAQNDGPVVAAAQRWRQCMGGTFLSQPLPESPALMPSPTVADRFGTNLEGSTVTQDERDLALDDVHCQASSGYRNALYDAEWKLQASVPKHDAELFTQIGDANERYRATVLTALAAVQKAGG